MLEQFSSIIPAPIYWEDVNSVILGANKHVLQGAGVTSLDQYIGKTLYELYPTAMADVIKSHNEEVMRTGELLSQEEMITEISTGKIKYFTALKSPLYDENGKIFGLVGTSIDITERKKMEEELRQAKEAAEAASLAKTAFIANMSHDIRTPLAGVIGMADMLALNLSDPERKQEAMLLSRSGNQLLNMLNEILDTVRAGNASEVDIQEETFDVYQCVQGLIELESPTTAAKHLGLQCEIDVNVPQYIVSDRKKIHHVLLNLLGNATKFTKIGGITIEIRCLERTSSHVHLQFAVADTGIGIPKKLQKKVFERFFRIDPSYKGKYEGYGLGLNIAQSYVNLLGGHLTLTSKEGVGTTFHFNLQCKIGQKEDVIHNGCIETTVNLAHAPHPSDLSYSINGKTPHLLLVEDNDVALKILESIVANAGCHFTSASDGESALELAKSIKFDLILTDIGLPGISGTELAAQIRIFEKIMNKSPVPIVGLTGHLQETAKPECMDCGMNDVFTKPINRSTMQMIIKTFVLHLLSDEPQNIVKTKTVNASTGKLGLDLPDTTEELFNLDNFPIFNPQDGLQYANLTVLINLLRIFISDEMQKDIHKMEQAYLEKNWAKVEALAHKLTGGVASIGLNRMRYACQYFERYYKTKQCMLLDKLYHQIIAVNHETVETIQKWLENYGLK